jgi:Spy/CpxP family protein refolding chaperone
MKSNIRMSRLMTSAALLATLVSGAVAPAAMAAEETQAPPYGPGWGMGPGMMGGYGPGYGMGPGMMGGGMMGMGPGMMGGGMGPGMMGGGMGMMGGPGMMGGGFGMGPGMMGGGFGMDPLYALNLTDEQRAKVEKILDEERKKHWDTAGKMMEEQNRLRDLYQEDTPDPKKVGAVYGSIAKLQQQMVENHIQARNQVQQILTKEQREQLQQWRRGGWGPGPRGGYGPGYGPRGMPGPGGMMGPGMMGR